MYGSSQQFNVANNLLTNIVFILFKSSDFVTLILEIFAMN